MGCYAIIPARGGSGRIKNKGIRSVAGKPLIYYSVAAANESGIFDSVYINSDSSDIISVAEGLDCEVYKRPKHLGKGDVFVIDVVKDLILNIGFTNDTVCVLLPTNPLRTAEDITKAHKIFVENNSPVVSVTDYSTPIQLAHYINENGKLEPYFKDDYGKSTRSTDHKAAYKFNEAIVFNKANLFLKQNNLIGNFPMPYYMPPERSIMLDYPFQLDMVRRVFDENK